MESNELLLCGSGVLAFAHIGVLQALEEEGVAIGPVCGSSTGALIAALYANGVRSSGIRDLFLNRQLQRFDGAVWLGATDGCTANKRMFCNVADLVPAARKFVLENGLRPTESLRIVCYDLLSAKPWVFEGKSYDLALALAASCAVPGISRPVRTGGRLLVDIATHYWQPESHCEKRAIISRAAYVGEDVEMLTAVDKWLRKRRHLLRVKESTTADCADHIIVETKLVTGDACVCKQGMAARESVITAGYTAAKAILAVASTR